MRKSTPQRNYTVLEGNPALAAWPVGAVFLGYGPTSPASLLGGGTWVQIAQGKMLVGQNSADADFDVVGDTGGSKTHLQTGLEVATHNHYPGTLDTNTTGSGHTHNVGFQSAATTATGGTAQRLTDLNNQTGGGGTARSGDTGSTGSGHTHGITGQAGDVVGSTGQVPMNIMNPYLVVYMWRRTA